MDYLSTILLYIFIFVSSTLFAFLSQRSFAPTSLNLRKGIRSTINKRNTNLFFFFLSFIIPWFFISFTKIGVDYKSYYDITEMLTWSTISKYSDLEVGFNFVLLTLKTITGNNYHVALFLLKTITIAIFYSCIFVLRDRLRLGYSVFGYLMLVYLPSFFLLSQCFASAIVLIAVTLYIKKKKILLPLIILLLATQIHNSCFLIIPCFLILSLISKHQKHSSLLILFSFFIYSFAIIFAKQIYSIAQNTIVGFHYNYYGSNDWNGSGLLVFAMYIPLLGIYFFLKNNGEKGFLMNALLILILTSLFFKILSYIFVVIERVEFLLSFTYLIIIPIILFNAYKHKNRLANNLPAISGFIFLYFAFRGFLVFSDFVLPRTGLASYAIYNPFY